jgi:hypothetical protein
METRIAVPGAMASAMVLGIAFSALVPTQMVAPEPPPWAKTAQAERSYERDPTWYFTPAPPTDLDPTAWVGSSYSDDANAGPPDTIEAATTNEVHTPPVYVAVDYRLDDRPSEAAQSEPVIAEPAPIPHQLDGVIY